jgi:hypothetical protein
VVAISGGERIFFQTTQLQKNSNNPTPMKIKLIRKTLAGIMVVGLLHAASTQASSLTLNFSSAGGTVLDTNGVGTGFTTRMAGTGADITGNDTNLLLNTGAGLLHMYTSPGADFNGQVAMSGASVPGIMLSTLGFSGANDFTATAIFTNIPPDLIPLGNTNIDLVLQPDQLCLVIGTDSANGVRAGFINFDRVGANTNLVRDNEGFGVLTSGGSDGDDRFFGLDVGTGMTVQISRIGGVWSVLVNGIDRMPNTSIDGTGTPEPPTFLDSATDLFVGVIAMDVGNDSPWWADLKSFSVVVSGNSPPSIASQPQKQVIDLDNPASFSVTVSDSAKSPVSYQWCTNNIPIAGATNSTLAIADVTTPGNYTVVLTNSLGSITSSVAPLYVIQPKGTFALNFNSAGGGITDSNGVGTGFPSRLSGTGAALSVNDTNLFLDTVNGLLDITTTSSDYNGGNGLGVNENLGVELATLGFTGPQDVQVTALFPQPFPATASFDQFGIIVGPNSLQHTRVGCITFAGKERYSENVQTNAAGVPLNTGGQYFGFAFNSTIPMNVVISRTAGVWHYYVDGVQWDVLTQPTWINGAPTMFAGVFAEDVVNNVHKTVAVDSFQARVFDPPTVKVSAGGGNLTFTWNVAGAGLQSNTDLNNPTGWVNEGGATTSPYVIPIPTSGTKFYRIGL